MKSTSCIAVFLALAVTTEAFKLFNNHLSAKRSKVDDKEDYIETENKEYSSIITIGNTLKGHVEVNLFETVMLTCDATSSPTPTIHWLLNGSRIYREGEVITDDEAIYENTAKNQKRPLVNKGQTNAKLVIDCVTPEDEGIYSCVAQTPTGRIVKSTRLIVGNGIGSEDHSCLDKRRSAKRGEAPVIYMNTNNRLERKDADVQLFCRASGVQRPDIVWTMESFMGRTKTIGQHKHHDSKYKVLPNGDLLVKSTAWEDSGLYTCRAVNDFGADTQDSILYVSSD